MFLIIFALVCFSAAEELGHKHKKFCPYDRLLVATRDNVMPPGTQLNYYDANFAIATSFGCGRLYNSSWPAYIRVKANEWLENLTGINWLAGTPRGDGSYVRAEGLFFPFVYGYDFKYRIHSDKVDCKETKPDENWIIFNTGYLVGFASSGTFPGGALKGKNYTAGQIVSYTEYNFLNEDKQDKWATDSPKWRQRTIIRSRQPGHNVLNLIGQADQNVYEELEDQATGEIGLAAFTVSVSNSSFWNPGGPLIQSTRNVMTWPQVQRSKTPLPSSTPCPVPN